MQYLLAVIHEENRPSLAPEEQEQAYKDVNYLNDEMKSAGALVFAGGLLPTNSRQRCASVRR